jgi:hypothetical protein
MQRLRSRLSHSNVLASVALVVALGAPGVAAAKALITGADIRDGTVSGRDIRDGSLRSGDIRDGSLHARDLSVGAARLRMVTATGPDIANYENREVIVHRRVPLSGDWLALGRFSAHNTGASDDTLNCAFLVGDRVYGAAGASVAAGETATAESVGLVHVTRSARGVALICEGSGATTFALSRIGLKLVKIA